MALQHLRSSTANKRPLPAGMSDGQLAINTNLASPGIFFKDSNGDLVKAGPVHVGTTAPNASPASGGETGNSTGELWLDTSVSPNQLKTWNGSAWVSDFPDEIPVAKLADGSARQLLQTDAAGTGVEWTSNVDVPGTLDVTGTATFDSIASHPLGTEGAPTITFTGDTNTGIYSPGADQVAISTAGTGRLFVNSTGLVAIGSGSFDQDLTIEDAQNTGTAADNVGLTLRSINRSALLRVTSNPGFSSSIELGDTDATNAGSISYNNSNNNLFFTVNSSERLRITSAGLVGIGTSSPGYLLTIQDTVTATSSPNYFTGLQLRNSSNGGSRILSSNANGDLVSVELGVQSIGAGSDDGRVTISTATNAVLNPAVTIDSSQRVGIGTTSPINPLEVNHSSATQFALRLLNTDTTATAVCGLEFDVSNGAAGGFLYIDSAVSGGSPYNIHLKRGQTSSAICFDSPTTEHARIDSSGRLLVGTSSAVGAATYSSIGLQVHGVGAPSGGNSRLASFRWSDNNGPAGLVIAKSRSETPGSYAIVNDDDICGRIDFAADDGTDLNSFVARIDAVVDGTPGADDMPGRLVFSTTPDGSATPVERMRINNSGQTSLFSSFNVLLASSAAAAGTTYSVFSGWYGGTSTTVPGTLSVVIYNNGDIKNTNNSYGAISDIKLKENIVDANSQWSDIKALQVRNYNFKEGQTHTQIGLIAQEVELVSPGLVSESPDRDEDGNDLGTTTKSVNYSVLYMKAVKALQEAMERIETLEAKVAALEGA